MLREKLATESTRANSLEKDKHTSLATIQKIKDDEATFFDFYVYSVMTRGSLRFLGKDYGRTLALVWEEVLKRSENVEEDYLLKTLLDEDDQVALAEGKRLLVEEQAESTGAKASLLLLVVHLLA